MVDTLVPNNPYVGPRAIESGEAFFGRDRETRSLSALLIAERIVLLHSPSGAGKSSLIQAGLAPRLAERFGVFPPVRVNLEAPEEVRGLAGVNRYVMSTLLSMEEGLPVEKRLPLPELAVLNLQSYLEKRSLPDETHENSLLLFDQFEEVLTVSSNDGPAKQEFFEQLGECLQNRHRWALFAIREDYMGGLAPYSRAIPNRLNVTFRLGLLGAEAAKLAIQRPAKNREVDFTDEAAGKLVDDLRRIQVQQPDGSFVPEVGPDVEPVQLQVVCFNLWQSHAADDKIIDENDLQRVGSVDQALASYYATAVRNVAENAKVPERSLRQWFDEHLITPDGIRSQVLKGAESTEGLPNIILRLLEATHLIRGETRAGKTWYELSHDRLVEPVHQDNAAWFDRNLSLLQRRAVLWNQQERSEGLLLRGKELLDAEEEARQGRLTTVEQAFLQDCLALRRRQRREQAFMRIIVVASLAILAVAIVAVVFFFQARKQTDIVLANSRDLKTAQARDLTSVYQNNQNNANATQGAIQAQNVLANALAASTQAVDRLKLTQVSEAQATAVQRANEAATTQAQTEILLKQAQAYRAQSLADTSRLLRRSGNTTLSNLLAIEAFTIEDDYHTRSNLLEFLGKTIFIEDQGNHSDSDLMPNTFSFSPDGTHLAAGYVDGTIVLWKFNPLDYFTILGWGSTSKVAGLAYSPDGKNIYKAELNITKGIRTISRWDALTPARVPDAIISKPMDHGDDVFCLAISLDGKLLATGSQDESIRLWDATSLEPIGEPLQANAGWVQSLAFSPDGKLLASTHRDGSIRLWDLKSQQQVGDALTKHGPDLYKVLFSPDGKLLASGGQDGWVILWDVAKHVMLGEPLTGHYGAVNSLAFSPNGKLLASGGNFGRVILWDVESRQKIGALSLKNDDDINNVAFNPTGTILAVGDKRGLLSLWRLDAKEWIKAACSLVSHDMTINQWELYFPRENYRKTCDK